MRRSPRNSTASTASYELVTEMAELGLMGMPIPEEYGGGGTDTLSYAIAVEELTRIDSSVAITMAAHTSLGTMPIFLYGSDEQKQQWLPELASGQKLAAFGLTEAGAGSDAECTHRAELADGEWVINGSKIFITNAGPTSAPASRSPRSPGRRRSRTSSSRTELPATTSRRRWRSWLARLDTRELSFKDARVPEGNLLGPRGKGSSSSSRSSTAGASPSPRWASAWPRARTTWR